MQCRLLILLCRSASEHLCISAEKHNNITYVCFAEHGQYRVCSVSSGSFNAMSTVALLYLIMNSRLYSMQAIYYAHIYI